MKIDKICAVFAVFIVALMLAPQGARAGLDLENQTDIPIGALDLDHDGIVKRHEVAEYMFYFFDHDGNETLTRGEYYRTRAVSVTPYEGSALRVIDLDNDGADDGVAYAKDSFLQKAMVGEYDPAAEGITAEDFIDSSFLKLDVNKSGAIEPDEWYQVYDQYGVLKPQQAPKAANNKIYNH